jgi:hypothetical protein
MAAVAAVILGLNTKASAQVTTVKVSVELDSYLGSVTPGGSTPGSGIQNFIFATPDDYSRPKVQTATAQFTPGGTSPVVVKVKGDGDFKNSTGQSFPLSVLSIRVKPQSAISVVAADPASTNSILKAGIPALPANYGNPITLSTSDQPVVTVPLGNRVPFDVEYTIDPAKSTKSSFEALATEQASAKRDPFVANVTYSYSAQ